MSKVFDFCKTAWSWFYERTVVWCIFAFFLLMGWGQLQKNELTAEIKEENLESLITIEKINFMNKDYLIESVNDSSFNNMDVALFAVESNLSKQYFEYAKMYNLYL